MTSGDLREKLIGTWRLASYEVREPATGEVVRPYGNSPEGIIIYTPQNYMSAQIAWHDRPAFAEDRMESGQVAELAEAARGYLAYAGPFHVADGSTVVHEVSLSLFPNWEGQSQYRVARLEENTLELAVARPTLIEGKERAAVLTWERVR